MPTTLTIPRTAQELFVRLEPCAPRSEGTDLVFDAFPPTEYQRALRVLHTGVRALLAERLWYGCVGGTGRVRVLNPAVPIPEDIALLCVAGDPRWDRIDPMARVDLPHLFAPAPSGSS